MLYYLLFVFFHIGLLVGIINGSQQLNSSRQIIPNKSMFGYWLGR